MKEEALTDRIVPVEEVGAKNARGANPGNSVGRGPSDLDLHRYAIVGRHEVGVRVLEVTLALGLVGLAKVRAVEHRPRCLAGGGELEEGWVPVFILGW